MNLNDLNMERMLSGSQCDDCVSENELVELSPNVFVLRVAHDETCPTFRRMKGKKNESL